MDLSKPNRRITIEINVLQLNCIVIKIQISNRNHFIKHYISFSSFETFHEVNNNNSIKHKDTNGHYLFENEKFSKSKELKRRLKIGRKRKSKRKNEREINSPPKNQK